MDEPVITGRTTTRPLDDVVGEALTARVTVDERGQVTGWNAGAERPPGYAADETVGRPAAELLAEPVPAEDLPPFAQLPRWHGELPVRHRDGRRLEIKVLAHHRTPEPGGATGVGGGGRAG